MNVLIFVMTMLMLLALMTYSRLETYRNSQAFQVLFENYMEKDERGYINMAAKKAYDAKKGSKKDSKNATPKVQASPRISLSFIINKTKRESAPQNAASFNVLLKNLIKTLYEDQPFYQKMIEQRPSFVDEIIEALIKSTSELATEIKKTTEIANLKLGDEQLDDVFYKMLRGAPYKDVYQQNLVETSPEIPKEQPQGSDDTSDEAAISVEAEEHHSPKGYFSLLDFINLDNSGKIRIYLASKEVLKAVYGDDNLVNDIISKRNELYHQAYLEDSEGVKSLSESFKNTFNNKQDPAVSGDVLDFSISKTNPKKYE